MEKRTFRRHARNVDRSESSDDLPWPISMTIADHYRPDSDVHQTDSLLFAGLKPYDSRASDSSSAYSGSDAMPSSVEDTDVDNLGAVDSDNEDAPSGESLGSLIVRDKVREYLEKDPSFRSDDDIEVLLDFMQHMPAFSNMTLSVRRELCAVMVFAVIEKADTVVLGDGELLDSWSVILNGHVEVSKPDGTIEHLHMGDSFGVSPTLETQHHCGTMRTKVDDCQFVCVAQSAYHQIFHKGEESMVRVEENGELVVVMEKKNLENGRIGQVVLRATPEKLMTRLIEDNEADKTYIEDFLLTYRTFLRSPTELTNRLVTWFCDATLREKVVKILLLWTSNHFNEFDSDPVMSEFLEKFEVLLEGQKMTNHLAALHSIYAAKSHPRSIVLSRTNRDDPLGFQVVGGTERNAGVFISKVDKGSKVIETGLKRGDQIIEVNNCSFERISCERALEILRSTTHIALTVKSNLHVCRQLLRSPESSPQHARSAFASHDLKCRSVPTDGDSCSASSVGSPSKCLYTKQRDRISSPAHTVKSRKAFFRFPLFQRADSDDLRLNHDSSSSHPCSRKSSSLSGNSSLGHPLSTSDPDLLSSSFRCLDKHAVVPEHVVRVYRADQSFRYLLIHRETTAREVVEQALKEFSISDQSSSYSLYEVTFEECGVRTKQLPDQLSDLADRCRLNSRYYLKNKKGIETLVLDELTSGILRECHVSLLQVLPAEVAIQLTLRDFHLFESIHPSEYINDLFELDLKTGSPNLSQFSGLVNQEMFWVVSEVCAEQNLLKRAKIIKQFIKIAKYCRMARNFNSFFAILSGLGHGSVSRLRLSWERLSTKYLKLFEEMQDAMDPSRNMSKYRNMLSVHLAHPPVIPFFPLVKKDLTFIHFGNDSRVDGLVNFDKLRMIAKEIRQINRLSSTVTGYGKSLWPYESILPNYTCLTPTIHGTIRHKKPTASALLNPKKMYDEALMAMRVRTYLANLQVIDDEAKLSQMSSSCELPDQTNQKRTDPLGSASSSSSDICSMAMPVMIPAFGSNSPTSVRKLLSLSDGSRPVNTKKQPPPPPLPSSSSVLQFRPAQTSAPSPSVGSSAGLALRRLKKQLPPLAVFDLSAESSSVTGVRRRPASAHCCGTSGLEGIGEKLGANPVDSAQSQLDSDSGHSSIASSLLDGQSPLNLSTDPVRGVLPEPQYTCTGVHFRQPSQNPVSPSSYHFGVRLVKDQTALTSPVLDTSSNFQKLVFQPPTPPNQRNVRARAGSKRNEAVSYQLAQNGRSALWNLEEPRRESRWKGRRPFSCDDGDGIQRLCSQDTANEDRYKDVSDNDGVLMSLV